MVFVDKVTVNRTKEVFYTGVIIQPNLVRESLVTIEEGFDENCGCDFVDLDAAGFIRSVSKFTYREFISIFKISIQDLPRSNKSEYLNLDEFSIYGYIDVIMRYINQIVSVSRMEKISSSSPKNFFKVLSRWKFTTSQKHQLKKILVKLDAKRISTDVVGEISFLKTGHEVILYFSKLLESEAIDWKKN